VKLTEADPVLGSTLFALLEPENADPEWLKRGGGKGTGEQMARRGRTKGAHANSRGR
jgi:ribonuclease R